MLARKQKEKQEFDENIMYIENIEVKMCYEHFKLRYSERIHESGKRIPYNHYWDYWITYMRGEFLFREKRKKESERIIRIIGNCIDDAYLLRIVYSKIEILNLYVPLTIYKVTDRKKISKIYKRLLGNKRLKKDKNNILFDKKDYLCRLNDLKIK